MRAHARTVIFYATFLALILCTIYLHQIYVDNIELDNPITTELSVNQTFEYQKKFKRDPPKGFSNWVSFAAEKSCLTDLHYYQQIYDDLEPWMETGVSNSNINIDRYVIGNDYFVASSDPLSAILNPISHLFKEQVEFQKNRKDEPVSLPSNDGSVKQYSNIQEVMLRNECMQSKFGSEVSNHGFLQQPFTFTVQNILTPIFSQAKLSCFKDILIPMRYHIEIAQNPIKDEISWENKLNVLFWRGSTTGGRVHSAYPWKKYHRIRLLQWAKNFEMKNKAFTFETDVTPIPETPFAVDIGFHVTVQTDSKADRQIKEEYGLKSFVDLKTTLKYKYLLVVDGNTWPSRLQSYLQTNSVILYNGIFIDWYSWMLKPMVHYVPIKLDLSDLEEKIEWLQTHDEEARKISENARQLMSSMSRIEQMQCYTSLLLLEYSNLRK